MPRDGGSEYRIGLEDEPSAEDRRKVIEGIKAYNARFTPRVPKLGLTLLLRDGGGEVRGGLLAETYWGWLFVDILWVDEPLRGQGHGGRLMRAAEEEAVRRGCAGAYLDTFDFQARPFYERLGYQLFGQLDDFPPGGSRYFLRKRLDPDPSTESHP
ncbi:MAG TPA: GNAT family N-acetyltransferase [Longimicrobium sp.]|nr:GNAT family N-acetyltransferase [Longimicrobium sp.]